MEHGCPLRISDKETRSSKFELADLKIKNSLSNDKPKPVVC